jgi:hypothetical protein
MDIKDDDIDKIKKEDYINFLLPAINWNNNLFYLYNRDKLDILQHYIAIFIRLAIFIDIFAL